MPRERAQTRGTLSVTPVIILTLIALLLFVLVWREETWPLSVRLTLMVAGIFFLAFALAAAIYWIQYQQAAVADRWAIAAAHTEEVVRLEIISRMTPEQLFYAQRYAPAVKTAEELAGWRQA